MTFNWNSMRAMSRADLVVRSAVAGAIAGAVFGVVLAVILHAY